MILTSALTLTTNHSGAQPTTPIVVSEVGVLYQTIWDTMERHFGLEITKPLLVIITIKIIYINNLIFWQQRHKIRVSVDLVS